MPANAEPTQRALRSDALANREKVLTAASHAIRAGGPHIPMAEIAVQAGVGNATLYRHFPTREDLLSALVNRSLEAVLRRATAAATETGPAIDSIALFFEQTIVHRDELVVLPLHGGPVVPDQRTNELRRAIREALEAVLSRGRADGSIRDDVTPGDVIVAAAQMAQPLSTVTEWNDVARRQARFTLDGYTPRAARSGPPAAT